VGSADPGLPGKMAIKWKWNCCHMQADLLEYSSIVLLQAGCRILRKCLSMCRCCVGSCTSACQCVVVV